MISVHEYLDERGRSPYAEWFNGLDAQVSAKIAVAVTRMSLGNYSNVRSLGDGAFEYKLDFGPEETATSRHRIGCREVAGLQAPQAGRE
jgi:putative component of toxin-antitoxin plasmid stabilization module